MIKVQAARRGRRPAHRSALRVLLERKRISTVELAARCGCHQTTINRILARATFPRRALGMALSAALGIKPRELYALWWLDANGD